MTPAPAHDGGRLVLRSALVVGLILRVGALWFTRSLGTPIVDEQHYVQLASNILGHGVFGMDAVHPTSMRPPLFSGLVAALWSVTGAGNLQGVRAVQILLALGTAAVVFNLGRLTFNATIGRYAAAICWLYPSLIFFNFTILTETLFTFLLLTFLLLAVLLVQQPRAWTALACGVALGLAALTRSVLWPFPLVLCPMLAVLLPGTMRSRIVLPLVLLSGFCLAIGPWVVRNTRLQGVFTVVDTMGGLNLRMGNYEHTPEDRMWDAVALEGEKNWSYALWQERPGEQFTEGQKDKWAQGKAVGYMLANPGITLRRSIIKFSDFWGLEREYAAGIQQGLFRPPTWFGITASIVIVLGYAGVVVAGALGMWIAPPDWRMHAILLLPVAAITGVHTLAFGHSRYHMPLMPIFGIYAAALFAFAPAALRRVKQFQLAGAVVCVLLLAGIWVHQLLFVDSARIHALFERIGWA